MDKYDEKLKDKLVSFVRKYRNYKPYDCGWGVVKKVWNHGLGAIGFFRVYEDRRIIAVNKLFWNKTDFPKLEELKKLLGGEWRIVWCEYGYTAFYNNSFSLKYAINENERD